jgi:acetoin utilization deacetylase AcuC-like enzyme
LKVYYAHQFELPLPAGHFFPMAKYRLLYERVAAAGLAGPGELIVPEMIDDAALLRVHDAEYVRRVTAGELSKEQQRRIGFPWSPQMVERSRRSAGATLAAARAALEEGVAVNLAGGTHHAFRGCGEGYCVFNDVAVAARALQAEGRIRRAVVIDCDAHQGNGTAAIFADDPSVFTFSIHAQTSFPKIKMPSDLDIALPDGTEDEAYLTALATGLEQSLNSAGADLAFYIAGADPFSGDRLGHLRVSKEGLIARDRLVLTRCQKAKLPVAIVMGGGYARDVQDTVDVHANTVRTARQMWDELRGVGLARSTN